ncbi:MAG: glycosyltransferase family 2 protein [Clostridia bacterium]|nr:glycosyltransferase family 2 protein [Clostridia bacterium]
MKVSVIIPVYNTKDYLHQCLDSLVGQTLEDIEILVVDDGSTDGSDQIIKEYEEKYPQKVKGFFKENGGQASARNLALQYAQGEYLGFVDSDDWVDAEMYTEMYEKAKGEDADIVICDTTDHYPTYDVYHHASQFESKFAVTPSACNKIFRRDFVGDIRFPEGLWYEDFEFTTKNLMLTEKISVIHKSFYHCHCREVSTMTNNNAEKNLDMLTVLGNLTRYVEEKGMTEKYKDVLEYLYLDHLLITTVNRLKAQKNKNKNKIIKQMVSEVKKRYPKFYKDAVFAQMAKNRKIIALLNYAGLSGLSKLILSIKAKSKGY